MAGGNFNQSTLNADIIPDHEFLDKIEGYQQKVYASPYLLQFSLDLLQQLCASVGFQSTDERVYKLISIVAEIQLCKILAEVKDTNIAGQKDGQPKTHIGFDDLSKALEEFGVCLRRPPFLEDKLQVAKNKK